MSNEMWTHENENLEFRSGFRAGLEFAISTVEELLAELKKDDKINEAAWVEVAGDWLEDELSMYIVGDEE